MKLKKKRHILFLLLLVFSPLVIFGQGVVNQIPWSIDMGNMVLILGGALSSMVWAKFQANRVDRNLPKIYERLENQETAFHELEIKIISQFVGKEEFLREMELSKQLCQVQKTLDQILANAAQ